MIGNIRNDRCCRTCQHIKTDKYPEPVCYERKRIGGNPVAEVVKPNQKACYSYKAKEAQKS